MRSAGWIAACSAVVGAVALAVPLASAQAATPACQVTDQVDQWAGGFTSAITVTNEGPAVTSWTVTWTFDGTQHVTSAWNASVTQTGSAVTAVSESYNGSLATGASAGFGFQGTFSGTNDLPVDFAVNGVSCEGSTTAPPTTTAPTTTPPTTPPTTTPPPTTSTTPPPTGSCTASVFCDGFENQTTSTPSGRWSVSTPDCSGTGTAVIGSAAHTGTHALQVTGADGFCNHVFADDTTDMPAASPTWFVRFWVRHTAALPTGHVTFLAMNDSVSGTDLRLGGQNGALMWNRESDDATLPDQSPAGVAQSVPLPVNTWTCVEFSVGGTDGQIHTWVNGTAVPGLTEDGVPTSNLDDQWLSGSGSSWRPRLTDLKLGWESYGGGGPDGITFDDVALGTSRIGC